MPKDIIAILRINQKFTGKDQNHNNTFFGEAASNYFVTKRFFFGVGGKNCEMWEVLLNAAASKTFLFECHSCHHDHDEVKGTILKTNQQHQIPSKGILLQQVHVILKLGNSRHSKKG